MTDRDGLADLATKIFECVSNYKGSLNNGEVITAHLVAAHILMTVHDIDFQDQLALLRASLDLLGRQKPVRVLELDASDLVAPIAPPEAN